MARVVKKKLSDAVLEEINRMFDRGELKEGDKLPNQNKLAAQFGVSRASLRESLHTLLLTGMLEQRPGFGTMVRGRLPDNYSEFLNLPLISDAKETIELVEARRYIEVANVELVVENASAEEIEKLRSLIAAMDEAAGQKDLGAYVQRDAEFHHILARATGNRFMEHLFLTIRRIMEQFINESFSALPTMLERSMTDHRRIFDALEQRDRKRAVKEMTRHMANIRRAMERFYTATRKDGRPRRPIA